VSLFFRVPWSHIWFWYAFFDANVANATHHEGVMAMVPLWSLAVEEQFYLVWPWVVVLGSRRTLKRVALGIIVATPVLRAICTPAFSSHWPIYCLTPFRADTLACGAFIAILAYEDFAWIDRSHYRASMYTMVAGVIFTGLSISHGFRLTANSMLFNTLGYSLLVVIFGGTLLYLLGSREGFVYAIVSAKPLRYLGLISYTFYLYHFGVVILLEQPIHTAILACLLSFAITGAIAALSWRFFESPILHISRVLESRRA
jgi:peptidoglycan/LPS O-acetylase OafA/YrhL